MIRIVALALVFPWLVACAPEAPPQYSVEVVVDTVVRESYQYTSKYIGRLRARDDVAIQARVTPLSPFPNRGVKQADFAVLKGAAMPAV